MFKKLFVGLCSLFAASQTQSTPNDNNKVIALTITKETKVRVGPPAELPDQLIRDLSTEFAKNKNIELAKISLAEFTPENSAAFFSYVIGLKAKGTPEAAISSATAIARASQKLPRPVIVVDIKQQANLFTPECVQFFTIGK